MYYDDGEPTFGCSLLMFIQNQKEIENWMSVDCNQANGVICQKPLLSMKENDVNFSCTIKPKPEVTTSTLLPSEYLGDSFDP